jgi:RimJ/RimL family protein N-acetyltransferase
MRKNDAETPLVTERLKLEPLLPGHAAQLYPYLRDATLYTYLPEEPPASLEALAARYLRLAARRSPDGTEVWLNWAARLQGADDHVGTFQATVRADATALIAYMIFTPHQRRGYAATGCTAVLDCLAQAWGVRTVAAEIDTRNAASIALVEALGFTRVGLRAGADFFKGSQSDEYRYECALTTIARRKPLGFNPRGEAPFRGVSPKS